MNAPTTPAGRRRAQLAIWLAVVAVTFLHYATSSTHHAYHTVYRRLYYLPIVAGAFVGGARLALAIAAAATLAYLPHAFLLACMRDPSPAVDKALEMLLYFGVALLGGGLVDRERRARRRAEEEQVQRAVAQSQMRALEALVHLARGLAHEVRNPLAGMQGALEIATDPSTPPAVRAEMSEIIHGEIARLDQVLSEFLEFAQPRQPECGRVAMHEVARRVCALVGGDAAARRVEVRCLADEPVWALADEGHAVQVLLNVVRNAIQHSPEGGVVTVRVGATQDGAFVEVADEGPGVPDELGDRIYDPYVSAREGGTGLGLAVSALLVRRGGGRIAHRRRAGGGACFTVQWPLWQDAPRDSGAGHEPD